MSAIQISLNPDLARLQAEGYRLQIITGASGAYHLMVEEVPAVNSKRQVVRGKLYSPLEVGPDLLVRAPTNHQCYWIGDEGPCDATGKLLESLIATNGPQNMGDGIITAVGLSRKRRTDAGMVPYTDYHEKVTTYVPLIWGPAYQLDPSCTPRVDRPVEAVVSAQESVFHYPDMATTRAGIGAATAKLIVPRIAIIGVGGTGSYILDLVVKTPVGEIHLFDGGLFDLHNAFRAPGAPTKEQLSTMKKVDWFADIGDRMRKGIIRHPYHVTADNIGELSGMDFVFLSIDDSDARKVIIDHLIAAGIPFIDVGMDLSLDGSASIFGKCRYTVGAPGEVAHIPTTVPLAKGADNNVYRNIQVADMNMLNAALAVIKWKKRMGFYVDDPKERNGFYQIQSQGLIKEHLK